MRVRRFSSRRCWSRCSALRVAHARAGRACPRLPRRRHRARCPRRQARRKPELRAGTASRTTDDAPRTGKSTTWNSAPRRIAHFRSTRGWKWTISTTENRWKFVDGRIIDLSLAAAREIDMVGPGLARVRLRVIEVGQPKSLLSRSSRPAHSPPPDQPSRPQQPQPLPASSSAADELYCAQAGAFSDRARAENLAESLAGSFTEVRVVSGTAAWRVLVGRDETLDTANQLAAKVRAMVGEAVVVKDR